MQPSLIETLPVSLRLCLTKPLPGKEAQMMMAPSARPPEDSVEYRDASVLIALYPHEQSWWFPLILRVEDGYPHGGQISLPGGRLEEGETIVEAALREAEEEVGISVDSVEVLGRLTPLAVPVSGYMVSPVVGLLPERPHFTPQPSEVQEILEVNVQDLVDDQRKRVEEWTFFGKPSTVPMFDIGGSTVWGATAMMLGELREMLRAEL